MIALTQQHRWQSAGFRRVAGRGSAVALALPLAAGLLLSGPTAAAAAVKAPLSLAAESLSDGELSGTRGGFAVGGFDLAVGIVSRSVIDQALGGLGERLEVVTRFTVPTAGRVAHAGTSVQALGEVTGGSAPSALGSGGPTGANVAVSTAGTMTTVDIGGTTRLTQNMLNTFVENTDVNRVITNQLDINISVGGVARRLGALNAARALRPAIQAQILYGPR
ncbi:MAG: hypothetical protein JNM75_10635 [Rhodospirillales bacterium]|nr:hypothetical protein [Rhodospirillales bacterium]